MKKLTLPKLDYSYAALEPHISEEIMTLHHQKHHQTYITKFNDAVEAFIEESNTSNPNPGVLAQLTSALNFNGGGAANHNFFWKVLIPADAFQPATGSLATAIESTFGSLESFKEKFSAMAAAIQGSGWAWLAFCPNTKKILITTTSNQDHITLKGLKPLLALDVWEHAYYLQYKNVRPDYIKNFWNIVNWKYVADLYENYVG